MPGRPPTRLLRSTHASLQDFFDFHITLSCETPYPTIWLHNHRQEEHYDCAMTEYTDSLATSPLCRNCCVLSFNDGEIGGIESHASNGQSFLDFPENLKGPRMYKAVRLEYDTSDVLPDLQHLQKSAEAGCAFCCALRSAVQDRGWSEPAVIKFDLRYIWCASDRLLDWGLQALLVDLRICSDGMEAFQVRDTLLFQIDCSQGKIWSLHAWDFD